MPKTKFNFKQIFIFVFLILMVCMTTGVDGVHAESKKPAQVKITSAKSIDYNAAKITWKKVKGADKYQVYRAAAKNGKYKLVGTTAKLSYTNKKLATGKKYFYKVRAVDNGVKGKFSTKKSVVPRLKRPDVKVTGKTQSSITLDWKNVKGANGYKVYRSTTKNGKYKLVATTVKSKYVGENLSAGKTYYYKVRAYRKVSGKVKYSYFSYADKVTTKKVTKLGKVSLVVNQTANHTVELTWNKVKNTEGYIVYRSVADDTDFQPLTKTKNTSYTDISVKNGTDYYYKVEAYSGKVRTFSKGIGVVVGHDWKPVYGEKDNGYYKPTYSCNLCNGLDVTGSVDDHAKTHQSYTVSEGQKPQKGYYEKQSVTVWFDFCNQCKEIIVPDSLNISTEEYNRLVSKHLDESMEKYWEFVESIQDLPIDEYNKLLSEYQNTKVCGGWSGDFRYETRNVWIPDEDGSETKMISYDKYTCNHCGKDITGSYEIHRCFINEIPTSEWVSKIEQMVVGYKCSMCGKENKSY